MAKHIAPPVMKPTTCPISCSSRASSTACVTSVLVMVLRLLCLPRGVVTPARPLLDDCLSRLYWATIQYNGHGVKREARHDMGRQSGTPSKDPLMARVWEKRDVSEARQQTTVALLDAAERLLFEVGYAGVTTRRVAQAAGVKHG